MKNLDCISQVAEHLLCQQLSDDARSLTMPNEE